MGKIIPNGVSRAAERQVLPWDLGRGEYLRIERFIHRPEIAAHHMRGIRDDHCRRVLVRIDVQQPIDLDIEVDFLPGFTDGCRLNPLTSIDESTGKDPFPIRRWDSSLDEHDSTVEHKEGAGGNLWVRIVDE